MKTYDDNVRTSDAERLYARDEIGKKVIAAGVLHDALAVFVLDPKLRPMLEAVDPKAVEQARKALLLI